jgi:Protein of unknown function (DUF3016)
MFLSPITWAYAGNSEVTWTNPEKYRDVKSGNESKSKFQARIFKEFEKHFADMASGLPEGYQLKVNVTDVDLAGDVNAGGIDRIRIISDLYFPRIKFSYELFDNNSEQIKAGGINLKDMNFLMGSNMRYRNKTLGYEKKMLDNWFDSTFESVIVKKNK